LEKNKKIRKYLLVRLKEGQKEKKTKGQKDIVKKITSK